MRVQQPPWATATPQVQHFEAIPLDNTAPNNDAASRRNLSFTKHGPNDKYVEVWVPSIETYEVRPLSSLTPGEFFQIPEHRDNMTKVGHCFVCTSRPQVVKYTDNDRTGSSGRHVHPDIILQGLQVVVAPEKFTADLRALASPDGTPASTGNQLLIPVAPFNSAKPKSGLAAKLSSVPEGVEDLPVKPRM